MLKYSNHYPKVLMIRIIAVLLPLVISAFFIPSMSLHCKAVPDKPYITGNAEMADILGFNAKVFSGNASNTAAASSSAGHLLISSRASIFGFSGSPITVTDGVRKTFTGNVLMFEGVKSKTDLQKASYMLDFYNKNTLKVAYNIYKQELTPLQVESYTTGLSTPYTIALMASLETSVANKPARIAAYDTFPARIRLNYTIFSGPFSYGSAYAGPWDLWFLLRASDIFWHNHWDEILPYKEYFNQDDFMKRDAAIKEIRLKGATPDTFALEPNVDADLQFSEEYIQKNIDRIYFTLKFIEPAGSPFTTLFTIFLVILALVLAIRQISDSSYRKKFAGKQKFY